MTELAGTPTEDATEDKREDETGKATEDEVVELFTDELPYAGGAVGAVYVPLPLPIEVLDTPEALAPPLAPIPPDVPETGNGALSGSFRELDPT